MDVGSEYAPLAREEEETGSVPAAGLDLIGGISKRSEGGSSSNAMATRTGRAGRYICLLRWAAMVVFAILLIAVSGVAIGLHSKVKHLKHQLNDYVLHEKWEREEEVEAAKHMVNFTLVEGTRLEALAKEYGGGEHYMIDGYKFYAFNFDGVQIVSGGVDLLMPCDREKLCDRPLS